MDFHTIPYLHHWSHLWPLGVGWPLTVSLLPAGSSTACGESTVAKGLLLLWAGIHFALIGGLLTKPMRYLLPMLPFLAILTADLCVWLVHSPRFPQSAQAGHRRSPPRCSSTARVTALPLPGIYTREDSRIEAARWMEERIPDNSRSRHRAEAPSTMRGLAGNARYAVYECSVPPMLFRHAGICDLSARSSPGSETHTSRTLDYLAILEANRYQQFTAVPDLIPGCCGLLPGAWPMGTWASTSSTGSSVTPTLGGLEFRDDGSDPSFTGYDHPVVIDLQEARVTTSWQEGSGADWGQASPRAPTVLIPYLETSKVPLIKAGDLDPGPHLDSNGHPESTDRTGSPILIEARSARAHGRTGPGSSRRTYHTELLEPHRIPADRCALATGM